MAIKTGRYGKVSWDPAGGNALVQITGTLSDAQAAKYEAALKGL